MIFDTDKNCGVCIHSSAEDGRLCEHLLVATVSDVSVVIARSASVSRCGPTGLLFEACMCLQPYCPRHGKDRRR